MQWTLELKFIREVAGKAPHSGSLMAEAMLHLVPESIKLGKLLAVEYLKNHSDAQGDKDFLLWITDNDL